MNNQEYMGVVAGQLAGMKAKLFRPVGGETAARLLERPS
jgi:hypothetical protein